METTFIAKIMSLLHKPVHYLYIGSFFIVWGYVYKNNLLIFIGIALFLYALASFTEWIYKKIIVLIAQKKYKDKVIKVYNESQSCERMILNHCIENNILTYTTNFMEEKIINAIQSLSFKEMGIATSNACGFILYENVLNILSHYIKGKNNAK